MLYYDISVLRAGVVEGQDERSCGKTQKRPCRIPCNHAGKAPGPHAWEELLHGCLGFTRWDLGQHLKRGHTPYRRVLTVSPEGGSLLTALWSARSEQSVSRGMLRKHCVFDRRWYGGWSLRYLRWPMSSHIGPGDLRPMLSIAPLNRSWSLCPNHTAPP